jgi:phage shock protein C
MRHYSTDSWFCNKANRKIAGVCSGLAVKQGLSVTGVRVAAVLLLLCFPSIVLFAYAGAALILPSRYIV